MILLFGQNGFATASILCFAIGIAIGSLGLMFIPGIILWIIGLKHKNKNHVQRIIPLKDCYGFAIRF